ncbi:hypothetical protein [Thalassotalea montiporae]
MKNKFLTLLQDRLMGYLHETLTLFSGKSSELVGTKKAPLLLVMSRKHYLERHLTYPITNQKELKAAIIFEIEELTADYYVSYDIKNNSDTESLVTIWQIPKEKVPAGTHYVIPESFLLARVMDENSALLLNESSTEVTAVVKGKEKSVSSIVSPDTLMSFLLSSGIAIEKQEKLNNQHLVHQISSAVWQNMFAVLTKFSINDGMSLENTIARSKPLWAPTALLFCVYMGATSAYVYFKHQSVQMAISSDTEAVTEVLNIQAENSRLIQDYEQLIGSQANVKPLWNIWQILNPLYKQGVTFQFIRFNGEQVFFKAKASSAATVLEFLYDNKQVQDPSFTTSVQKSAGLETFIIKFKLAVESEHQDEP